MKGDSGLPAGMDAATLARLLSAAHAELMVAILLSVGMLCAFILIVLAAMGYRRWALGFGLLYAVTLCGVPVGYARVLGPCGISVALVGLMWPMGSAWRWGPQPKAERASKEGSDGAGLADRPDEAERDRR